MKNSPIRAALFFVLAAWASAPAAHAASYYWFGDNNNLWTQTTGPGLSNWSTTADSNQGTSGATILPTSGSDNVFFVLFGATNLNTEINQPFTINSLTFTSDATNAVQINDTPGTNKLTIGAGGITNNGPSTYSIGAAVGLGATQIWANNGANALTVSGVISGAGTNNLTLGGGGGFVFSAANTYTGTTSLLANGTTLTLNGANGALATPSFSLDGGTTLNLDNTASNNTNRILDTTTIASNGATIALKGTSATETVGTLTLNTGATRVNVDAGSTLTFSNSLGRSTGGTIDFSTAGTTVVSTQTNAFNAIIGGYATIGTIGSVQLDANGAGNVLDFATVNGSHQVVPLAIYASNTFATPTSDVKLSNTTTLTNGTTTTINSLYITGAGTLILGTVGTTTTKLIIGSGGIISNAATQTLGGSGPQINYASCAELGSGVISTSGNAGGGITGTVTSSTNDLVITTASNLRMDCLITNNGATVVNLVKNGSGLLDLSDGNGTAVANTYTGITTINGGLLTIKGDTNLGAVPSSLVPNSITFNGGELRMYATITLSANRGITVGPQGGTLSYNGGNTTILSSNQITGTGAMTFANVPGAGGVSANLCATEIAFPAGANNYAGPTTFFTSGSTSGNNISSIILFVNDNQVPDLSAVTVTNNDTKGVLNLVGHSDTWGSLAGNGNIVNGVTTTSALTVGGNNLSTTYTGSIGKPGITWPAVGGSKVAGGDFFNGTFPSTTSNISITKIGSGTMTMSGVNGYTGATSITGGTLLIGTGTTTTGAGSLANTTVTVGNGTLIGALGGNGTINGPVNITSTGHLAPAMSSSTTNTLTLASGLSLVGGSVLDFNFAAPGATGTGVGDQVNVTGLNLSLAGAEVLNVTQLSGFGIGTYKLFSLGGGGTFTDTATFTVNAKANFNYFVLKAGDVIDATVGGGTVPANQIWLEVLAGNPQLTWKGTVDGNWNTSTANWVGDATVFTTGSNVTFDDTGIAQNGVTIVGGGVSANTMTVSNSSGTYTLGGGAITITAGGGLSKSQGGSIILNTSVTTPTTAITAGAVTVGGGTTFNSTSSVALSNSGTALNIAGTLTTAAMTVSSGSILTLNSGASLGATAFNVNALSTANINGSLTGTQNIGVTGTLTAGSTASILATDSFTINSAGAVSFAGSIASSTPIANSGSLTFSSASQTLSALSGTGSVTLTGTALTLTGTTTINETIGGSGSLATGNSGTITLAQNNTYSGGTTVTAGGTLAVSNPTIALSGTGSGPVTVNGTLGGTGSIAGTATINGTLAPSLGANTTSTLTASALTLSSGAILNFNCAAPGTNDLVTVTNALTFPTGGCTLNINAQTGFAFGPNGQYVLATAGTVSGAPTGWTVNIAGPGAIYTGTAAVIAGTPNKLVLQLVSTTMTWTGLAGTPNWGDAANWSSNPVLTPARAPISGDTVILTGAGLPPGNLNIAGLLLTALSFDATATSGITIVPSNGSTGLGLLGNAGAPLSASLSIAASNHTLQGNLVLGTNVAITVPASTSFTVTGVISGAFALTASGGGTVTLPGAASTYTGVTSVTGGTTLIVSTLANNGTVSSIGTGNLALTASTLQYTGGATGVTDRLIALGAGASTIDPGANGVTLNGGISGTGSLIKLNTSTLTLGSTGNSFSGGLTISAGLVLVPQHPATSFPFGLGTVTLAGGNLSVQGVNTVPSLTQGLAAKFFNVTPQNVANADPDMSSLAAFNAYAATSANANAAGNVTIATTATNGTTNSDFNFSNGGTGNNTGACFGTNPADATHANYGFTNNANFVARFDGYYIAPTTGSYTFQTTSDDGSVVFLDGVLVVNNNVFQGFLPKSGTVTLTAGLHAITIGYYQGGGNLGFQVQVLPPGGSTHTLLNSEVVTAQAGTGTADSFPNAVTLTADSSVAITNTPNVTFGTLSMGNIALGVTGMAAANLAFTATTLTGNPSFNPSANTTLSPGALADGGVRTITINAGGATTGSVAFPMTATTVTDGTTVKIAGGTLKPNIVGALGALANINLTSSTAVVSVGANQTFGQLNGVSGSSVLLNGNTLAVGASTVNANGTFNGVISDGSAAGGLTKVGTGMLFLSGASSNTYTGQTTIVGGDLRGTGTLSASTVVSSAAASASVWPGVAGAGSGVGGGTSSVENMNVAALNLSGGGKVKLALNSISNQELTVTNSAVNSCNIANGTLSLGIAAGTSASNVLIVNSSSAINAHFAHVIVNGQNNDDPGTGSVFVATGPGPGFATVIIDYSVANTLIFLDVSGTVSPVKIDAFEANVRGAGVGVSWTAVSEYKNAGFNVYRRALGSDAWSRCNAALIAGRITNADEKQYSYYDWTSAGTFEYKLESVGISDEREFYYPRTDAVSVDWNSQLASIGDVTNDAIDAAVGAIALDASVAQTIEVSSRVAALAQTNNAAVPAALSMRAFNSNAPEVQARSVSATAVSPLPSLASSPAQATAGVRWFTGGTPASTVGASSYSTAKLVYVAPGVMLIPQASMPAGYDINHVSLQREGRYFPALAITPAGLLVYLPGYQDDYTDKDAVFLRRIAGNTAVGPNSPATGLFTSALQPNVTSAATVETDYHDVYFDFNYLPATFAPWFSGQYLTQGTTQNFTLNTPLPTSGSATITVNLWSLTQSDAINPDHGLTVLVNNQLVGSQSWDGGGQMLQFKFTIPPGVLVNGDNTISLSTPSINGLDASTQIAFLHSMVMNYTRLLDGSKTFSIVNSSASAQMYELYNIPAAGAYVVDTRFTDHAALVPTQTVAQPDGTLHLRFIGSNGGTGQFLVVPAGQTNSPLAITVRQVKAARLSGTYLATGPSQFGPGAQTLLTARAKEGVRGSYVDQEQLFDYYNYGRYGPDGIRKAVRSLRPQYLLLLGKTTYDYRNYSGLNVDPLCPTYLISTSAWAQTTSDAAFGDLGRGYTEVAIGRLPVADAGELSTAVSRILSYKGPATEGSGIRLHAVADQLDPDAGDFAGQMSTLQASHPELGWQPNYLGVTYQTSPEVHSAMSDAANGGADLIMYAGHGNATRLGKNNPRILDNTTIGDWKGNVVFIQATCTANWDANNVPGYHSIAMQGLTQSGGGISASIASSTYMNSDAAAAFMNQLLKNIQGGSSTRWGTALMKTQQWAASKGGAGASFYSDLSTTEQIFGDPAMRVYAAPARGSSTTTGGTTTTTSGTQAGSF